MSLWIKICGITTLDDAQLVADSGADALGVNLVPSSKRYIDEDGARAIVAAVGNLLEVVAVVADRSVEELVGLRARLGVATLQLHGSEPPECVAGLLPGAYQAVRIGGVEDVVSARAYGGTRLLADAKVGGELGGTGRTFDWSLVAELARERALVLAGGLTPDNVAAAVRTVRPYGVDTASGVETADPRRKDASRVRRFIEAARRAAREAGLDKPGGVD